MITGREMNPDEGPGIDSRLITVKKRYEKDLLAKKNVVGVGIGFKNTGGRELTIKCIKVYVERKEPRGALADRDIVPRELEGLMTDVEVIGKARSLEEV